MITMSEESGRLGLVAYNFEPEFSEEELRNLVTESPVGENVATPTLEDWCSCNECQEMPSPIECLCCRSCEYVQPNIDELECITEHSQFELLVLNPDVLAVAFIQIMMFKRQAGRAPDNLTNVQSRLAAYRQFVCWMLRGERLVKGKRVVIPACVVSRIRAAFPEPDGQYTGFQNQTVFDNNLDLF